MSAVSRADVVLICYRSLHKELTEQDTKVAGIALNKEKDVYL